MGGVGKTALAVVLAHRLAHRYPDAQLYLNLRGADPEHRPPITPAQAMQYVIHCFKPEARLPETLDAVSPFYNSVLAEAGRVLLLLDNAADAAQVRPLLPPLNCLLLVTSRAQFQVPGLATRNLDCLPPAKSKELLLKLASRLQGHAEKAAELCGHLPLALAVLAGVVNDRKLYPVPELLERLRSRQDKLAPVDAAFQVSYEVLSKEQRRCWTLLAVFPSSFDLRAASAIWAAGRAGSPQPAAGASASPERRGEDSTPFQTPDSACEAMQALVNASLVEWNETNGRFRLHDLVRQFCDGQLTERDRAAAQFRHARHYCDVASEAQALYRQGGGNVLRGLELFDRERTHSEAAFARLHPPRDHESGALLVALVNAVTYIGNLRLHPRQQIGWLEAQRDAARLTKHRQAEGSALGNLGNAYLALGDARKAIEFHEQALIISRAIGDRRGEGNALGNLGSACFALGDARKAIEFYEQQLGIAREIGVRREEGNALCGLGNAYAGLGEARRSIGFYEEALVIRREIGDRLGEGNEVGSLGNAYAALGDARKAIEFHEQALAISREIGHRRGEANTLGNLGMAYRALGDARKAIEFYDRALVIVREIGDRRGEGNALWNSARALDRLGDRAQAVARADAALRIFEAIEDPNAAKVRAELAQWRGQ